MRPFRAILLLSLLAGCDDLATSDARSTGPAAASRGPAAAGDWIVVLRPGVEPRGLAAAVGASPRFVYANVLNGFAARLTPGQVEALGRNPGVAFVEPDQRGGIATTQLFPVWGLDRIDQTSSTLNRMYTYTATGAGVNAYLIDTAIDEDHPQFGTRADNVWNWEGAPTDDDCHGHGTHVAGTIGGVGYGVAKQANLKALRVVDCFGWGTASMFIAAVDWLRVNHEKPAVVNMSVGYPPSVAVDSAVLRLSAAGVFVSVAAGNEDQNACLRSPARAASIMTVAAVDSFTQRASYSNWGNCVDIYAPGTAVRSAWPGGGSAMMQGTSMASPHVAGTAALYKAANGDASQAAITYWILTNSTTGAVYANLPGTPNRLVNKRGL